MTTYIVLRAMESPGYEVGDIVAYDPAAAEGLLVLGFLGYASEEDIAQKEAALHGGVKEMEQELSRPGEGRREEVLLLNDPGNRRAVVCHAIRRLDKNDRSKWTTEGQPRMSVLKRMLPDDFDLDSEERDEIWDRLNDEQENQ